MPIRKNIRVVILSLAAFCLIAVINVTMAESDGDNNIYQVEDIYEVTIPSQVSLDTETKTGTVRITGTLAPYYNLNINVDSKHNYQMVHEADSGQMIAYTISSDLISFSNADSAAEKALSTDLSVNMTGAPGMSGVYTDILTFTIDATDCAKSHTVSFNVNTTDDVTTSVIEKEVKTGRKYGELPTPTRDGYTFEGWYTAETGGEEITSDSYAGEAPVTLYAHWRENVLTIVYHADGATRWNSHKSGQIETIVDDIMYTDSDVKYATKYWNGSAGLINAGRLKKTGYHASGYWKIGSVDSTDIVSDDESMSISGAEVAQRWGLLEQFKKSDITVDLYPVYVANTYTVVYNTNATDAVGTTANSTHTYDTESNLTANGYARSEYVFTGWNTAADGNGTAYTDCAKVLNLTAANGGKITLYAQWLELTETITVDLNVNCADAVISETSTWVRKDYPYGYYKSLPTPTRDGYTFEGWYTAGTGGEKITSDSYAGETDIALYAQWRENVLTVVYNAGGAAQWYSYKSNQVEAIVDDIMYTDSDVKYATKYWNGNSGLIDVSRVKKTGYHTNGLWNVGSQDSSLTVSDKDHEFATGASLAEYLGVLEAFKSGDTTVNLYPAYIANTYTVVYSANATDAAGATANSTHTYDMESSLTMNGYTRSGYIFAGWNTAADGNGTAYADCAHVLNLTAANGGKITLYAQWNENTESSEAKARELEFWDEEPDEEAESATEYETDEQAADAGESSDAAADDSEDEMTAVIEDMDSEGAVAVDETAAVPESQLPEENLLTEETDALTDEEETSENPVENPVIDEVELQAYCEAPEENVSQAECTAAEGNDAEEENKAAAAEELEAPSDNLMKREEAEEQSTEAALLLGESGSADSENDAESDAGKEKTAILTSRDEDIE